MLSNYLPQKINTGPWVTAYTLDALRRLPADIEFVLPICSLATPYHDLAQLGDLLLPPLFHEALDDNLRQRIVDRILQCFPAYDRMDANRQRVRIVDVPAALLPAVAPTKVLAFSVDTAVEEHGPHLPLATDTIQSYSVLNVLADRIDGLFVGRPLEYGQLSWGLPFGFSVDLTAELLTAYVTRFANAVEKWHHAEALYVVDVHGSFTHRQAIVEGLRCSNVERWSFRWLHEPLVEFASSRGDQHAGGVETALVEYTNPVLLDPDWWPDRLEELADHQMSFEKAVELTPDLPRFIDYAATHDSNGIIGNILNYRDLDPNELFRRMLQLAHDDVQQLISDQPIQQNAGEQFW
jgi:creatinine amidohydrolase